MDRQRVRIVAAIVLASSVSGAALPVAASSPAPADATASSSPAPPESPSPSAADLVQPGSRHADIELEALLPTTLGGANLLRESQLGTELTVKNAAFDMFLSNLGRAIEDFSLASAYSPGGNVEAQVGAWRIKGADREQLLPAYVATLQASSATPLTVGEETLAGRLVTRIGAPGELTQGPLYVFVYGEDTLLFVQTTDPTLAEEALAKLPE